MRLWKEILYLVILGLLIVSGKCLVYRNQRVSVWVSMVYWLLFVDVALCGFFYLLEHGGGAGRSTSVRGKKGKKGRRERSSLPIVECYENSYNPQAIMYSTKAGAAPLQVPSCTYNPQLFSEETAQQMCYPSSNCDPVAVDQQQVSINQRLVGKPNPKTLQNPILAPRIYDSIFKPNPFFVTTGINERGRQELYQNGYIVHDQPVPMQQDTTFCDASKSVAQQVLLDNPSQCTLPNYTSTRGEPAGMRPPVVEHYNQEMSFPHKPLYGNALTQGNSRGDTSAAYYHTTKNDTVPLDVSLGYFPSNSSLNYPTNYPLPLYGCADNKANQEHYQNAFYTSLGPDTGIQTGVIQPDSTSSNLGISYTQQNVPGEWTNEASSVRYREFDPLQAPASASTDSLSSGPAPYSTFDRSNFYDPRFTGYGTSYRSYVDEMTGQPRFFYDDIEAHTQPNYLCRSNIDFAKFSSGYGPYADPDLTSDNGLTVREKAQDIFTQDTLFQRNDMQRHLMRKNAHREWQLKLAPLQQNTARFAAGGGGGSSFSANYAGPRGR